MSYTTSIRYEPDLYSQLRLPSLETYLEYDRKHRAKFGHMAEDRQCNPSSGFGRMQTQNKLVTCYGNFGRHAKHGLATKCGSIS